jgi:Transposase DDE domain
MRRHRDQELLDRARRQANTKQAKLDRKRRQHLIERSFADASNLHGFKRARWRGLIQQSIQDLVIAGSPKLDKTDRGDAQTRRKIVISLSRFPRLLPRLDRRPPNGFSSSLGPSRKRLRRNSYGLGDFRGVLDDDVPIVSESGELFFGRFHAPTIPEIGATRPNMIADGTEDLRLSLRRTRSGNGGER